MAKQIYVIDPLLPDKARFNGYVDAVFDNHILTNNGPLAQDLEARLKERLKVKHLLICANGTLGLEIAIHAAKAAGGKVVTTPFTYVATLSAALWVGCEVIFADIDPETLCMDPAKVSEVLPEDARAVIPVDVYGHPCDFAAIRRAAGDTPIIYDAAQAFGSELDGRSLFSYGDFAICSLHATKAMHTFEGGFIVCGSKDAYDKACLLRAFGHVHDTHYCLGINAKMSEIHAAMGLALLPDFEKWRAARKAVSELYDGILDWTRLRKPRVPAGFKSNFSYYPIIFESEKALLAASRALRARDIVPRRYFYPALTTLPYVRGQSCPVAESIAPRVLCLPLYAGLAREKAFETGDIVNGSLARG